jgi:hypothetical protein
LQNLSAAAIRAGTRKVLNQEGRLVEVEESTEIASRVAAGYPTPASAAKLNLETGEVTTLIDEQDAIIIKNVTEDERKSLYELMREDPGVKAMLEGSLSRVTRKLVDSKYLDPATDPPSVMGVAAERVLTEMHNEAKERSDASTTTNLIDELKRAELPKRVAKGRKPEVGRTAEKRLEEISKEVGGKKEVGKGELPPTLASGQTLMFTDAPLAKWVKPRDEVLYAYQAVLQRLAGLGIDVTIFTGKIPGLPENIRGAQADKRVAMGVTDLESPSAQNLVDLFHEVGHQVFGNLDVGTQQLIHEAIDEVGVAEFGLAPWEPAIAEGIPKDQRAKARAEEYLIQATAERLAQKGFNPNDAASMSSTLWRAVKEILISLAMHFQRWWNDGKASTRLAQAYFQLRMESMLAGNRKPVGLFAFLNTTPEVERQHSVMFDAVEGEWEMPFYDDEIEGWHFPSALPDSKPAIDFNLGTVGLKFTNVPKVLDPAQFGPGQQPLAETDIAANNELFRIYQGMQRAAEFDGEFSEFLELIGQSDPVAQVGNSVSPFQEAGMELPDASATYDGLPVMPHQQLAAAKAFGLASQARNSMWKRRKEMEARAAELPVSINNTYQRAVRLRQRYTDASVMGNDMVESLFEVIDEFRRDVRQSGALSHRRAVLAQMIQGITNDTSQSAFRAYERLADRIWRGFRRSPDRLFDIVDVLVRNQPEDQRWSSMTVAEIASRIGDLAPSNRILRPLVEESSAGRVTLAAVAAFLKTNSRISDVIQLRQIQATGERAEINDMIRQVLDGTQTNWENARQALRAARTQLPLAERLFNQFASARIQLRRKRQQLEAAERYIDTHDRAIQFMDQEIGRIEEFMGVDTPPIALVEGEEMLDPESAQQAESAIKASPRWKFSHDMKPDSLMQVVRRWNQWLEQHPTGGRVRLQIEKQVLALQNHTVQVKDQNNKSTWVSWHLGSIGDRAVKTGLAEGKQFETLQNKYSRLDQSFRPKAVIEGNAWMIIWGKAQKAAGFKTVQAFDQAFFQPILGWLNDNKNRLLQLDSDALYREIRREVASRKNISHMASDAVWPLTRDVLRKSGEINGWNASVSESMGLKVEEEIGGEKIHRAIRGHPLFWMTRHVSKWTKSIHSSMVKSWIDKPLASENLEKEVRTAQEEEGGMGALNSRIQGLFTSEVWKKFVGPFANKTGQSIFSMPLWNDGTTRPLADPHDTAQAYAEANGNIFTFIDRLYQAGLERYPELAFDEEGNPFESRLQYALEVLDTLQNYFNSFHEQISSYENRVRGRGQPPQMPHQLVNARISEAWAPEFLTFSHFDQHSERFLMSQLAYQAAFGRRGEQAATVLEVLGNKLKRRAATYDELTREARQLGATGKEVKRTAARLAKERDEDWSLLQSGKWNADKGFKLLHEFDAVFAAKSGQLREYGPLTDLLYTLVGAIVQGPRTSIVNTMSINDMITVFGLSRHSAGMVKDAWKQFWKNAAGSFLEAFGIQTNLNLQHRQIRERMGFLADSGLGVFSKISAEKHSLELQMMDMLENESRGARAIRTVARVGRSLLSFRMKPGIKPGEGHFAELRPFQPFYTINQWMHYAVIEALLMRYETMLMQGIEFAEGKIREGSTVPETWTSKDLGWAQGVLNPDESFDRLKAMLQSQGIDFEKLATQRAMERINGQQGDLYDLEMMRGIASIAMNNVIMDSNITNRPPGFFSNPVLRITVPLWSWMFAKANQVNKVWRGPRQERLMSDPAPLMYNAVKVMLAMLPVTLVYSLILDMYDEEVIGKKSRRRSLYEGEPLAALIENIGIIGSLGLYGDLASGALNYAREGDSRGMTLDGRMVIARSFIGASTALTTAVKQRDITYQSVIRPLFMAIGGNGYLQYVEAINRVMTPAVEGVPLFEQELHVTRKINAENYLRAAGRSLGMEVRTVRGRFATPSIMSPHIGNMVISAVSNDAEDFWAAYQEALVAARKDGKDDPAGWVADAFSYRNPLLSVFRTRPTTQEYSQLLGEMGTRGRGDVSEAVRLFNYYATQIGGTAFQGKGTRRRERPPIPIGRRIYNARRRAARQAAFSF